MIRPHLRTLALLFVLAVCARILIFSIDYAAHDFHLENTIHGDDGYFELSLGILAGKGLSADLEPPYDPSPLRTPIYPYLIAAILFITGSYWAVLALQILIGSLTPLLSYLIAHKLTGIKSVALFVGLFMVFEPYHVLFSTIFYTETLFIALFLSFVLTALYYFESPTLKRLIVMSALLAVATLTKPTVQFLPVLLIPLMLWHFRAHMRGALIHGAIFTGVFLLILSPWFYRNYQAFGVVGMTAQPAYNLIIYLVPSVLAVEEGIPISESSFVKDEGIVENDITLTTASKYKDRAIEILKDYPVSLFKVTLISFVTFYTHDGMLTVLQNAGITPSFKLPQPAIIMLTTAPLELAQILSTQIFTPFGLIVLVRLINIFVTFFFIAGLAYILWKRLFTIQWLLILTLVAYFMLTTPINGLGVNARFRMPVEPILLTVATLPLLALIRRTLHTDRNS